MPIEVPAVLATIVHHVSLTAEHRKRAGKIQHPLVSILVIGLLGVIANCDGWAEIEEWAQVHQAWLRTFLSLPAGIPDESTLGRAFEALKPAWLDAVLVEIARELGQDPSGGSLAIDGKTLRSSGRNSQGRRALHIVHAWSVEGRMLIAQRVVESKENELVAIRDLLSCLNLEGVTVTMDAMGTQRDVAQAIVEHKGDYMLAVGANQPTLQEEIVMDLAPWMDAEDLPEDTSRCVEREEGHGRVIERTVVVRPADRITASGKWYGSAVIVYVRCRRIEARGASEEWRSYISSRSDADATIANKLIRRHWAVENECHWILDVAFREDASRMTLRNSAANFSRMRALAATILKSETTKKRGIAIKRKRASMDPAYLLKALAAFAARE